MVGISVLSAAIGVVVGSRLKSPADAANEREAPAASVITVPVEMRKLVSTLVVSGQTQYVEPTPVRLAGAVGTSAGDRQVVTRIPELNSEIAEGGLLMEISGRPVFAMRGELPMYRQLTPGAKGPDVLQLETSLEALGFPPGTVDDLYDAGTEAALDAFYLSRGYSSEGASETERRQLTEARKAVTDAEEAVRKAKVDLAAGTSTVTASERLERRQALDRATAAVPEAQNQANRDNDQAAQEAKTATALRDNARAARDADKVIYDAAAAPGAINPATGVAYTPAELAVVQQSLIEKDQALIQAEQVLSKAIADQQASTERGLTAVKQAQDALALAQAQLTDLDKPRDTAALREAVTAAQRLVTESQAGLEALEAEIGTIVPAGEVVFLPTLPTTITTMEAVLGAQPPADQVAQVSSTDTQIVGRISKVDADLVVVGTPVTIELRNVGIETTGVLTDIRTPTVSADPNNPGSGGDSSGRLEVVVIADDTSQISQFLYETARISIEVSATEAEVLAVPVAAISVGPDGTSRVEVEREAARGTRPGTTELVEVTVGLSAQGYAEIAPVAGASLVEGDRVVVGVETGERRTRRSRTGDTTGTTTGDTTPASG
ncbi:MAG: peptidoglycan-binding domain-containing protein [Actinomycetota bacterium]